MFLANFIFVALHLNIRQVVYLNTSNALTSLRSKRKVHEKFTSFCYSYVLTCVKNDKMVAERVDLQIEQTRTLII